MLAALRAEQKATGGVTTERRGRNEMIFLICRRARATALRGDPAAVNSAWLHGLRATAFAES